ncbi:MAG: PAS domain S-box protein [Candidatus Sulfotelmatobacter sp.]
MATSPPRRGQPPKWADTSFCSLLEAAPDAMLVVDRAGTIVVANEQAEKLFGYGNDELIGRSVESLIPPRLRAEHPKHRGNFFGDPRVRPMEAGLELFALRQDGTEFPVEISLSPLTNEAGTFIVSAIRDATERRRVEELKNAEVVLRETRESEQRFRLVADTAPVLIWMSGTDKLCTYFNKPWLDFTGRSMDSELGNGWAEGVHPEDLRRCLDTYTQSFDRREKFRMEYRLRHHDGKYRWILDVGVPRFNEDGSFAGYIGICVDVNERKRTEEALRESEEQFRTLAEAIPQLCWMAHADGHIFWYNQRWYTYTGTTPEQMEGWGWQSVHDPQALPLVLERWKTSIATGEPFNMVFPIKASNGVFHPFLTRVTPVKDSQGKVVRWFGTNTDVTELRDAEEAVRASEERLRLAQHIARIGSFDWNVQTGVNTWTPELEAMYGLQPGAFGETQTAFENLVHADDRAGVIKLVDRALKTGQSTEGEWRAVLPDGSVHWIAGRWQVLMNESGEPARMIGVNIDVTERKRVEEALRESETRERKRVTELEAILDAVPVPIRIAYDTACGRMTGNRAEYKQSRVPPGNNCSLSAPPGERPQYRLMEDGVWVAADALPMQQAAVTGKPVYGRALTIVYEDGTRRLTVENAVPLLDEAGKPWGAVGTSIDLTELKQAEQARRESEDKLRLLLDSTAEAIYGIDLEHRCTFCNPACLRSLGYEHIDQVLGKNTHDLIHHTRSDGTLFPVQECRVHRVIRTGEGVHAEDEVFWRANGTSFPIEYWSYPQRRGEEVVGAVVAFIDITERKLAEAALANVSRKLIEAQEQERTRIGRELHDDIGQRLAMLAIELQQLHENSLILPEVRSRMDELRKQTSEIAADIQSLSHELHSAKLQYLGLAVAMKSVCRDFAQQQKVEIDCENHDMPSALSGDISLALFRVFQEALHNSLKHSGVRQFEVRLWGTSDEIHLTVKDSGAGFDLEVAKTSRGLGLTSMEERVKLLNGTLSIESQPNRGTMIHARVPLSSGSDSMRAAG